MAKIAFDIDNTLYKIKYRANFLPDGTRNGFVPNGQSPDFTIFSILINLKEIGNKIFLWSAGGLEYTQRFAEEFGIRHLVVCIEKSEQSAKTNEIDITFDDQEITLGKVNIRIPRFNPEDN